MKEIIAKLKLVKNTIVDKVKKNLTTPIASRAAQKASLDWFFKTIKQSRNDYKSGSFTSNEHPFIGGMFHFLYDPKHKATLKYYDTFPLVIPIGIYPDGFLGLNLHYLPPIMRAKLLDALIEKYKKSTSARTYMAVSYDLLKSTEDHKLFKPCIHRYLTDHMRSAAVMVTPDLWEEVAFLPTWKFEKATHREVWAESKKGK
jgi:hypothetical protein